MFHFDWFNTFYSRDSTTGMEPEVSRKRIGSGLKYEEPNLIRLKSSWSGSKVFFSSFNWSGYRQIRWIGCRRNPPRSISLIFYENVRKSSPNEYLPVSGDTFREIFCIWLLVIGHRSFHGLIRHKAVSGDSLHLDDCYNSQNIFGIVSHSFERFPQLYEFCFLEIHVILLWEINLNSYHVEKRFQAAPKTVLEKYEFHVNCRIL